MGRDIGELPKVRRPSRRKAAVASLRLFLETYFPRAFTLAWSEDHLKAIARIEQAIRQGGLFALAMPRGTGKTTLVERAVMWAILTGRRRFVVILAATQDLAASVLDKVKAELMFNDLLLADFPEVCHAIRALENNARRCVGQLFRGKPTHVQWGSDQIVMPSMGKRSRCNGSVIATSGITGAIRGISQAMPGGEVVRPDFVFLDDPQDRESAMSPAQCAEREAIIKGDVLGLAGPGVKIAGMATVTVIRPDDLADRLLDRGRNPEWQGERCRMVRKFAEKDSPAEKLWKEYGRIRHESLKAGRDGSEGTEFYRAHRAEMDAGHEVSWAERKEEGDLSALQHAMNLKLRDEASFNAEYQNDPKPPAEEYEAIKPEQVRAKASGLAGGVVPLWATHVVAFIDCGDDVLFWGVMATAAGFRSHVVAYGPFPDQGAAYFVARDATERLSKRYGGTSREASLRAGLDELAERLCGRAWRREDGVEMSVGACLVDAGDGDHADVVYEFCRMSPFKAVLKPSKGRGVGPESVPWELYPKRAGETMGHHWLTAPLPKQRLTRLTHFDSNYWKTFLRDRIRSGVGGAGSFELFGRGGEHPLLPDHFAAEYAVRVTKEGSGRTVTVWRGRPAKPDNHLFDVFVGCHVAASTLGIGMDVAGGSGGVRRERKKYSAADLMRARA